MSKLNTIDLTHNSLTRLSGLSHLAELKELWVSTVCDMVMHRTDKLRLP